MLNLITHDLSNIPASGVIQEIQMARPPVNALNLAMLQALRAAVRSSGDQGARGIYRLPDVCHATGSASRLRQL